MKWIPILLIASVLPAAPQWLNYHDARTPRSKDGKPNLTARPPRVNGKPDLSGVWHVEPTSLAEMKQLFGANVDTLDVPGMEADTISKYAVNILLDFKPDDVPMRPQTALRCSEPARVMLAAARPLEFHLHIWFPSLMRSFRLLVKSW